MLYEIKSWLINFIYNFAETIIDILLALILIVIGIRLDNIIIFICLFFLVTTLYILKQVTSNNKELKNKVSQLALTKGSYLYRISDRTYFVENYIDLSLYLNTIQKVDYVPTVILEIESKVERKDYVVDIEEFDYRFVNGHINEFTYKKPVLESNNTFFKYNTKLIAQVDITRVKVKVLDYEMSVIAEYYLNN